MTPDVRSLFKVVGKEGSSLRRVEEAIAWLISPKAEKIGEKLLNDAYALHGKPLTMLITDMEQTGYHNLLGEHAIHVNPRQIAGVSLRAPDGRLHAASVERALAHELVHAGQPQAATAEWGLALDTIRRRAHSAAASHFTPAQLMEHNMYLVHAANASDYHTARQHVTNYVDKVALPLEESVRHRMHSDPQFTQYVAELEAPAIAIENRVANLRGEPLRGKYATAHEIEPQELRQMMINQLSSDLAIQDKKGIPPSQGRPPSMAVGWRNRIQKPRLSAAPQPGPGRG